MPFPLVSYEVVRSLLRLLFVLVIPGFVLVIPGVLPRLGCAPGPDAVLMARTDCTDTMTMTTNMAPPNSAPASPRAWIVNGWVVVSAGAHR